MHSDQTRKDGTSESMIQALYYDFVANYVKTRMYSTRYVQCNSGGQSSADKGATLGPQRAPCLSVYIYLVRQSFWSCGGPRTTRKRKPAHLEFKGHMR